VFDAFSSDESFHFGILKFSAIVAADEFGTMMIFDF
jgi:hypothetical protein